MQKIVIGLLTAVIALTLYYTYYIIPSQNKGYFGAQLISGSRGRIGTEKFIGSADLDYKMGEYSNIKLNKEDKLKYDKVYYTHNDSTELIDIPQPCDSYACINGVAPSVDGCKDSVKSASIFKFNKSSPECCPGPYSTSSGCVCLTPKQKNYISFNRGNNNN